MSKIETFNFTGHQLRVVTINGAPWFVAVDACRVLGYVTESRGTFHATRHLDASEKRIVKTPSQGRGNPNISVISESGLYKLVMRSDKPQAKPFQTWVTSEVLPAIRGPGTEEKTAERKRGSRGP